MGRVALVALALALGCASRPPVILGARMPEGCTKKLESERCFGWLLDRIMMVVMWKPYADDAIRRYVEDVGLRIARTSGERRPWKFRVIDDGGTNAYSGFLSTIYITRGAIGVLRDESELASIIAHEMAHSLAGHHRENMMDFDREVAMTEAAQLREYRYARDDEIQADELAVVLLARAGYDVHGYERMLRALGAGEEDEDDTDDRHPIFRERIARAVALASRYPEGERARDRFNAKIAGLVVGFDPRDAAVLDRTVVFARGNIALDLPRDAKTFQFGSMVFAAIHGDELAATFQLIDKNLVRDLKNDKPDSFTHTRVVGKHAISITVVQPDDTPKRDLAAAAKVLADSIRAPRRDELAQLRPIRFDPTVPRPVWAN